MQNKEFYIFIFDHDTTHFSISGPIDGECVTDWLKAVEDELSKGRQLQCFDLDKGVLNAYLRKAISDGYTIIDVDKIIIPPRDTSADYKGKLPKYAQKAKIDRVVKLLCKGGCKKIVWAEMNVPFPGKDILNKSDLGDYTAQCLVCKKIAKDCYNWSR
ncbi:MAG: hypothetical protein CVV64_11460 [Candidatus Wallbacteria bacterium HGW-Wallbacteria-1]|jgi:hypothetical protein|uniref:Uncharacterized protein n=1 Tax=Candidatus Wallbacteria bacterium HGW-Wallbacteria-1 TaxID=2013854 RepID=A0A2N1PNP2_9BACT|nr:MAG: hypothetical protein CVV64_11460 [Candidatus Wallbacteria bacterium HGW-Wallbacteria-1]